MIANLDGCNSDRVLGKNRKNGQRVGESGTDEIPDVYMARSTLYGANGLKQADVAVLIGGK